MGDSTAAPGHRRGSWWERKKLLKTNPASPQLPGPGPRPAGAAGLGRRSFDSLVGCCGAGNGQFQAAPMSGTGGGPKQVDRGIRRGVAVVIRRPQFAPRSSRILRSLPRTSTKDRRWRRRETDRFGRWAKKTWKPELVITSSPGRCQGTTQGQDEGVKFRLLQADWRGGTSDRGGKMFARTGQSWPRRVLPTAQHQPSIPGIFEGLQPS